jgi:hypothetical protein
MDMNGQRKIFATVLSPPPKKKKYVHGTCWVEGSLEKKISLAPVWYRTLISRLAVVYKSFRDFAGRTVAFVDS